jgi:protein involved in polysaccharide export with SLBB domain
VHRIQLTPWLAIWFSLSLLSLTGCLGSPGNRFSLFPQGHDLLPAAKNLRMAASQSLALPRELEKQVAPTYTVEPGDVLLIQPASLESPARLPGDQPVLPDGSINLGRYGRLIAAGKTVEEIETAVKGQVEAQTKDAGPINVRLVTRQSKVYYVLGEVNAPGVFTLNGRETVLDAVLAAGGLTDRANHQKIILSRPSFPHSCRSVLPICYDEIVQLGDSSTNYQIAAGDRIFVPSRSFWDEVCPKKKDCPPCGKPQTPCLAPGGVTGVWHAPHESVNHETSVIPFMPQRMPPADSGPPLVNPSGAK